MKSIQKSILLLLFLAVAATVDAQYFGRNKPQYEKKKFKVVHTPNFAIYNYLKNEEALYDIADYSEEWYDAHYDIFQDTFLGLNPLVLYNDHADFQQTTTIGSSIGAGTGGVTDAFKQRIIFPFAMSNQQTHHVLGHEMVHAFQYNLVIHGDSTSLQNLANLPLWMVEGLAEYLSIGRYDTHTAMWMRDAVLNDDVPSIKDLNNYGKYFPYRYGQAFWAYITTNYGDDMIEPLFANTAKYGLEIAVPLTLVTSLDSLSEDWVQSFKSAFGPYMDSNKKNRYGKKLLSEENSGHINVAPSISPNGRYLIYLTEKDLFSTDLFLADARSGKILRKLTSTVRDGHIDALNYIESSGTWSPRSDEFAYVAYSKGQNKLIFKDPKTGKTTKETFIQGVPAFSNPTWSPDGKSIVVTGLVEGQIDLYQYVIKSGRVTQLTDDKYAELLPAWSPNGYVLLFSTDEWSMKNGRSYGKWSHNIATLNMNTGDKEVLPVFNGADNMNPVFNAAGEIVFLSDRDGFRNMYRYNPELDEVHQMTDLPIGISGITKYAPALSVSTKRDRILYTEYKAGKYVIRQASGDKFLSGKINPDDVDKSPGVLFEPKEDVIQIVDANLQRFDTNAPLDSVLLTNHKFKSKFKLDYIAGSTGVGVGTGNFGTSTGLAGGVALLFSDILGRHQIQSVLSMNGEISDFGGMVSYVNQVNKVGWGASLSHIPYRSGRYGNGRRDTINYAGYLLPVIDYPLDIQRMFEDRIGGFGFYPFSQVLRVEGGANYNRYSYRIDRYHQYYEDLGSYVGQYVGEEREKLGNAPDAFNLFDVNMAVVGDNSTFGLTAPLKGYRFRVGANQYFGDYDFSGVTVDYRRYAWVKPVSFAVRGLHFGRYGSDSERIYPIYLGNPVLIRGFYNIDQSTVNRTIGSKVIIGNAEIRLPFTGPKRLALIPSKYLLSDLNLFFDAGVAYSEFKDITDDAIDASRRPLPLYSAGVSLRINLFGALILEPFYAIPIGPDVQHIKNGFGFNIAPGW